MTIIVDGVVPDASQKREISIDAFWSALSLVKSRRGPTDVADVILLDPTPDTIKYALPLTRDKALSASIGLSLDLSSIARDRVYEKAGYHRILELQRAEGLDKSVFITAFSDANSLKELLAEEALPNIRERLKLPEVPWLLSAKDEIDHGGEISLIVQYPDGQVAEIAATCIWNAEAVVTPDKWLVLPLSFGKRGDDASRMLLSLKAQTIEIESTIGPIDASYSMIKERRHSSITKNVIFCGIDDLLRCDFIECVTEHLRTADIVTVSGFLLNQAGSKSHTWAIYGDKVVPLAEDIGILNLPCAEPYAAALLTAEIRRVGAPVLAMRADFLWKISESQPERPLYECALQALASRQNNVVVAPVSSPIVELDV